MLIERDAFAAVDGFDEQLFLYKEDEDLCLRVRDGGGQVLYEPVVVVRHHGSVVADRQDALGKASSYYFAKHFPTGRRRRCSPPPTSGWPTFASEGASRGSVAGGEAGKPCGSRA